MKTIHRHPFTIALVSILLAATSPAQTPAPGSIGLTVKNAGAGSSILWLAPEAEKVLGFDESGQLTVLTPATANETEWGSITGTLTDQSDLQAALNTKAPLASPTFTGTVTIPSGASISGFLTESTAATTYAALSGSYADPPWINSLAKSKVGLGNVENTALSTWTGTSTLTTLGTITAGTWQGTAIADSHIASASAWNSKINQEDLDVVVSHVGAIDIHLGDLEAATVKGPDSATDNALVRFDNTTGKLTQSSSAILNDSGALTLPGPVSITGGGNALSVTGNVAFSQFASYPHMSVNWPTNGAMTVSDTFQFIWSFNGSYFDGGDVGIKRAASGKLKITNGSTGYGSLDALSYALSGAASIQSGSSTPESAVTAPVGSLFLRTNGSTGTTLYIKESGTGNTGWIGTGSSITDPNVAYIRTDGSDTTGDGSPGKPFLTFQKAVDEGFKHFDFGVGNFGSANFTSQTASQVITIRGTGTVLTNILNFGFPLDVTVVGRVNIGNVATNGISTAINGGNLTIRGDSGLYIDTVQFAAGIDDESEVGVAGTADLIGPFEVTGGVYGGASSNPSGTVYLSRGVRVPMPVDIEVDNISIKFAIVNGMPHVEASSL